MVFALAGDSTITTFITRPSANPPRRAACRFGRGIWRGERRMSNRGAGANSSDPAIGPLPVGRFGRTQSAQARRSSLPHCASPRSRATKASSSRHPSEAAMSAANDKPVWLITGCSTGFGRELAKILIERGYRVAATARDLASFADLVRGHDAGALALRLDV